MVRAAPQQRADTREQLGERKRLDEIVVGAFLQAAHAVLDAVARGQHQHRRLGLRAHRFQHAETVDAGQHDVEQQQVVVALGREAAAFDAVARDVDDIAVLGQAAVQVVGELGFVFDDEQTHGGRNGSRQRARLRCSHFPAPAWITNLSSGRAGSVEAAA
jgi:hypothetical protein